MMDKGHGVYANSNNASYMTYTPGVQKVSEGTQTTNGALHSPKKIPLQPHVPPRISSSPSRNNNTQQVHPESPIPPRLSSLQQQHQQQQQQLQPQSPQKTTTSHHLPSHDQLNNATSMAVSHTLEPSPTLSSTDTSTSTNPSVSSPGKTSVRAGASSSTSSQLPESPTTVSTLAAYGLPHAATSVNGNSTANGSFASGSEAYHTAPSGSPSSSPSSRSRVRPVSYSPTKVTDPSAAAARLTSLATTPIPPPPPLPANASPRIHQMASIPPVADDVMAAGRPDQLHHQRSPSDYSPTALSSEQYSPTGIVDDIQQQQQGASNALLSQQLSSQQQQQPSQQLSSQQQQQRSQPLHTSNPTLNPTAGAGGGYQIAPLSSASASPRAHHASPFGPPNRASTMEPRKVGSLLLPETHLTPHAPTTSQQFPPGTGGAGEGSSTSAYTTARPRRKQIYRRNTCSADLGSTSYRHSDGELEMDELEEARRRMEALKKSSSRRMSKRKKDEDDDRVLIGTRIGEDHVNYVLMYNMLTGIRVS
ncbi:hypothetical protein BGW41_006950, partial [Actinomortierella wolfii]